ncbi:MAG TPA: C45 family peptidase, partial [Puia sp.]|nr:C45 family peptidase [Puia sp.]
MKYIILPVLFAQLFIYGFAQNNSSKRQLRIITVSGSGYQRGYQHGQQLKKEIAEVTALWKKNIKEATRVPPDSFVRQFLASTNFIPAIKRLTPDILEEVRGIAAGAEQSFDDMLAAQLGDELWVYEDNFNNDSVHHHCSSIGVPAMKGNPAYVSQNMDIEAYTDNYQTVLHILPNRTTPEQFILTYAGQVALNGVNEFGIGVCVNTLMQLNASTDGLPVSFMIRALLARKKGSDALHFLQNTHHASGQNYILGIVDSVYDFEASAGKVARVYPDASGIVYHTNHPVANSDIKPLYQSYYKNFLAGNTKSKNSEIRYAALMRRAVESKDKDDAFIKSALRSKDDTNNPICRAHLPNKSGFTFGSVIFTLSNKRSMQV